MKFGRELASQMVPEWQEAYMDYSQLKTILKDILQYNQQQNIPPQHQMAATSNSKGSLTRRVSLYRAFSGLTSRYRGSPRNRDNNNDDDDNHNDEPILVSAVQGGTSDGYYQTMFLMSSSEEGEDNELLFFRKLDDEFNKVVKFYKAKVGEVLKEAEELNKQMDALIALRIKVDSPVVGVKFSPASVSSGEYTEFCGKPMSTPGSVAMDAIQEVEMSNGESSEDENRGNNTEQKSSDHEMRSNGVGGNIATVRFRPASLEVLNHVKIHVAPETPLSTLKGILMSSESNLSFSKKELSNAEKLMAQAFIEFYEKLRLLKNYSFLNLSAFSKIMKKYDKITSKNASKVYLQMVDKSYLGSSNEVIRLMARVEAAFIKHFANGNRRNGMSVLRPQAKRERHAVTYFLGLFSGCSIALIVAIVTLIHATNVLKSAGRRRYMENIFPLYSLFGFMVLHMLMYSANIFFWRRYRVNYAFIFGFKKGTELGYREVILLSLGLAVLTLAGVLSNLDMEMDPRTKSFGELTELVPLGLVLVVLLIAICPFNIIYRTNRYFFITCVFHCICAPLYKVTLPDFFLADQLTSQVQAFRNLQFYVCYYGWGDFEKRSANTCEESKIYSVFYFVVAVIPYWMRFIQCVRRLIEEKDVMHGINGFKYLSTIVAVVMRTSFQQSIRQGKGNITLRIMAAVSSGVATLINTYWDLVMDWGLLRRNSRNPWLRDKLLISTKSVYFAAMVSNVILRLAWMQQVLGIKDAPFQFQQLGFKNACPCDPQQAEEVCYSSEIQTLWQYHLRLQPKMLGAVPQGVILFAVLKAISMTAILSL